jgi:hypothetical protein
VAGPLGQADTVPVLRLTSKERVPASLQWFVWRRGPTPCRCRATRSRGNVPLIGRCSFWSGKWVHRTVPGDQHGERVEDLAGDVALPAADDLSRRILGSFDCRDVDLQLSSSEPNFASAVGRSPAREAREGGWDRRCVPGLVCQGEHRGWAADIWPVPATGGARPRGHGDGLAWS